MASEKNKPSYKLSTYHTPKNMPVETLVELSHNQELAAPKG